MFDKKRLLQRFIRITNEIRSSEDGSDQQKAAIARLCYIADHAADFLQANDKEDDAPIQFLPPDTVIPPINGMHKNTKGKVDVYKNGKIIGSQG